MLPLLAFIGGLTAAVLIFFLSYRFGEEIPPSNLILTGVALSSGYGALTTLLTLKLDERQMEFMARWVLVAYGEISGTTLKSYFLG